MPQRTLASRTQVRQVECPECYAPPKAHCMGLRGKVRESNHAERVQVYLARKARGEDSPVFPVTQVMVENSLG